METVHQGSSYWQDFILENYADFNSTWDAAWTGTYKLGTISGSLTRSTTPGIFNLRLNYTNSPWAALTPATYSLYAEFTNTGSGYREEYHGSIKIKTQGITV